MTPMIGPFPEQFVVFAVGAVVLFVGCVWVFRIARGGGLEPDEKIWRFRHRK